MRLLEYEAKQLLSERRIPIPLNKIIGPDSRLSLEFPVLKSQVPVGGRGKAGGIKMVDNPQQLKSTIEELFKKSIKGHLPKYVLAEEKLAIKKEFYLSLLVDRSTMSVRLMAHIDGGVDVEDNTNFKNWELDGTAFDTIGQELADYYNLPGHTFALQDLIEKLYRCFTENDALLLEINPLVLTEDDRLVAGDCKMALDDAAVFRHEWHFEDQPAEANFVTIDPKGNVATIANGAGLAMATVDAAYDAGLSPANFLDIGGGANTETLLAAFKRIMDYGELKAIVINIFAGITRADEVARAIVAAGEQIPNLPPLFIRLAGTNYDAAANILNKHDIAILPNLDTCLAAARETVGE